jgi:alpha-ketoglutarate-dependent 2,4-dichlorophenoxyacetate dioxygenase
MSLHNVELLHPDFGARVTNIDLREQISVDFITDIQKAIDEYSFLCFPNQPLNDDLQLAFTQLLGEPEPNHVKLGQDGVIEHFGTIGNVQEDGSTLGNDHQKTRFQTGNNLWHSDSSFRDVPTYVSIMCAYEVPDEGGATEFVSERASYERLPDNIKSMIDPLVAIHDYVFSRSQVGPDAVTSAHAASLPPVRQKLVRKNPNTGAKNFFAGSHAKEIEGWNFKKSRELLDDLVASATAADHVYSHAWKPGDLVIWDNRCLLHRGGGYDADKYRRRMRQTRVKGVGPTIDEI